MKKTMKQHSFTARLKSLAVVFGIALAFASCANEDVAQNPTNPNEDNDKDLTTFVAGDETKTRTSMDYTSSNFFWEAGDRIYVKDDNNVWRKSTNAPSGKVASFKFKVPGKFTKGNTYKVYYPGKNGSNNQVTIPAAQTQKVPNTTDHFGVSGDCGTADASWSSTENGFAFTLDHQAAILVLQPYNPNTTLKDCYLTKVVVTSDNNITGIYTLDPSSGELTGTGTGKQIVVTTSGSSTFPNGFPIKKVASVADNSAYILIKPGTHTLTVKYTLKDIVSRTEGTVTKTLSSFTYDKNTYYDMTANLDIKDYDGDHYYQWDAQEQYWKGFEWTKNLASGVGQPTLSQGLPAATTSSNYAQNSSDSRYYHEGGGPGRFDATQSCAGLLNVNEMTWYAAKGNPHWDKDKLWTTMGHLYKGGVWFKKKAYIIGYSSSTAVDGTDWRINENNQSWYASTTPLSAADANNYFFLPTLGYYDSSKLYDVLEVGSGYYWSSSAKPGSSNLAYDLFIYSNVVRVSVAPRYYGCRVGGFE